MSEPRVSGIYRAAQVLAVVGAIAAIAAALLLSWRSDTALEERGVTATAQVVATHESRHGVTTATVRFRTPDGRTITTTTRPDELAGPPPAIGSTIAVVYDPADPQAPVRDPRAERDAPIPPLLVAGAGVVFLGVVAVAWLRRRVHRRSDSGR